jgi:hypothetical protein
VVVIVPGRDLTKGENVAAMGDSPGWTEFRIVYLTRRYLRSKVASSALDDAPAL